MERASLIGSPFFVQMLDFMGIYLKGMMFINLAIL